MNQSSQENARAACLLLGQGAVRAFACTGKTGTGFLRVKNSPNSQFGHNLQTKSKQTCSIICYALTRKQEKKLWTALRGTSLLKWKGACPKRTDYEG